MSNILKLVRAILHGQLAVELVTTTQGTNFTLVETGTSLYGGLTSWVRSSEHTCPKSQQGTGVPGYAGGFLSSESRLPARIARDFSNAKVTAPQSFNRVFISASLWNVNAENHLTWHNDSRGEAFKNSPQRLASAHGSVSSSDRFLTQQL